MVPVPRGYHNRIAAAVAQSAPAPRAAALPVAIPETENTATPEKEIATSDMDSAILDLDTAGPDLDTEPPGLLAIGAFELAVSEDGSCRDSPNATVARVAVAPERRVDRC